MNLQTSPQQYFVPKIGSETVTIALNRIGENATAGPQNMKVLESSLVHLHVAIHSVESSTQVPANASIASHLRSSSMDNVSSVLNEPFRSNSMAWLKGSRLSNAGDNENFLISQILDIGDALNNMDDRFTQRSVCHPAGSFRKPSTNWNVSDEAHIEEWTFRLTYLAVHSWHQRPAQQEARDRRDFGDVKNQFKVPTSDFECPGAKFLITSMARLGFGASFRIGAVNSILMGIATNRVTLFLNNIKSKKVPIMLQESLWLASCEREDMQCSFLATSPCVVTMDDLVNRTRVLPENLARVARRRGVIEDKLLDNSRYIYAEARINPAPDQGIMARVQQRLVDHARMLITEWEEKSGIVKPEKKAVLEEALKRIQTKVLNPSGVSSDVLYSYTSRESPIHHAVLLYLLRLRRRLNSRVDAQVKGIIGTSFNPDQAIGLPIRGSDKCDKESTCLPFDKYVSLAHETWTDHFQGEGYLVITTEDSAIANASRSFNSSQLSLLVNPDDVLQNTGRPRNTIFRTQADAVMKSTLVALKLQLHTKFTIGNCCSNFHLLLFDLQRHGCGMGNTQQCLQETKNPEYHVCCQWTRTEECDAKRNATKGWQ